MTLDERLFHQINEFSGSAVLDAWSALVRASELWILPALVILALALWRGGKRARGTAILALAVFTIGDTLCVWPTKIVFARPRPDTVLNVRSVRLAPTSPRVLALIEPLAVNRVGPRPNVRGLRSFPSGHAWNTFALATVLVLWFRRWGWLAYMPAAAVALSRVHAGLHWPSDIAASAILSVPVTVLLSFGLNAAWKRCIVPRCPRVGAAVPSLLPERDEA